MWTKKPFLFAGVLSSAWFICSIFRKLIVGTQALSSLVLYSFFFRNMNFSSLYQRLSSKSRLRSYFNSCAMNEICSKAVSVASFDFRERNCMLHGRFDGLNLPYVTSFVLNGFT